MPSSDIVVIGAGVIGSSIAYRLSQAGYSVTLLERGAPGSGASGACDQAIFLQSKRPGLHMRLALASRRLFDSLEEELDAPIEFSGDGGMVVIQNEQQWNFMESFVAAQRSAGIEVDLLDRADTLRAQPLLGPSTLGASHSPLDGEVNPLLLNAAFLAAARRLGARLVKRAEVTSVIESGGRIRGVVSTAGVFHSDLVINAAGPWAGEVSELAEVHSPISPRRGAILITEALPRLLTGVLLSAQYVLAKHLESESGGEVPYGVGLSLGQTAAGNLLIGGSREFVGFSTDVPTAVIQHIARHAIEIIPSLQGRRVIRTMKGYRPYTGDGLPIIEESRPGWITAAGHEGDGIALAPITGFLVRDLITGSRTVGNGEFLSQLSSTRPSLRHPLHTPRKQAS